MLGRSAIEKNRIDECLAKIKKLFIRTLETGRKTAFGELS
jgi:hypothetical protein